MKASLSSNEAKAVIEMSHKIAICLGALVGRDIPAVSLRREEGQTMVEYALIIAVIALAVLVAMTFMQGKISSFFSEVGNQL